ncbi:methanethiol S-methyltransferase [Egicoccus sp. AB-alg6-2]|uniref:methanethiol S-methyltransferase n=1 Tax=Egicoccus sp. AB-alg6-2 TaxID=3242692 RepID=UPI00359E7A71
MTRSVMIVGYGVLAYLVFLGAFAYTMGFLANAFVPRGIDDGAVGAVWLAVLVDAGLLGLFALQHTVMARPAFKRWWTRFVPPALERSTFVLAASLVLILLLAQWRPLPTPVWTVEAAVPRMLLWATYALGWIVVVASTFLIDHFELFGLRQVVARARERRHTPPPFRVTLLYAFVRHPIMVGFLIVFWATPDMSQGRLLFAALGTAYIVVGVRFEEHDLRAQLGEPYRRYEAEVPRFVPRLRRRHGRGQVPVDVGASVAQDG